MSSTCSIAWQVIIMNAVDKRLFIGQFIYAIIGLVVAFAVLPVLQNSIDEYTGDYAALVNVVLLVVIAGLVFVALRFGMGSMK
jgi:hypothetical protein